jgi:NAD-dependent deacetylase
MKNLIVLSGAGISAESGIKTFRDSDGLWENHDIMEVASPEGWYKNKELVIDFYNQRRRQLAEVEPNDAHKFFAEMDENFNTTVITQNVDDLHERAGSKNILHLHGELTKVRSVNNTNLISEIGYSDIQLGDKASDGAQLRPHIVWFGEDVPMINKAVEISQTADIFVVIGTSLNVYPAASLVNFVRHDTEVYVIDPNMESMKLPSNFHLIKEKAVDGVNILRNKILNK